MSKLNNIRDMATLYISQHCWTQGLMHNNNPVVDCLGIRGTDPCKGLQCLGQWAETHPWGTVPWLPRQSYQGLLLCINPWVQQCWDIYSVAISLLILRLTSREKTRTSRTDKKQLFMWIWQRSCITGLCNEKSVNSHFNGRFGGELSIRG